MSCERMDSSCPTPRCSHPAKRKGECCPTCDGQYICNTHVINVISCVFIEFVLPPSSLIFSIQTQANVKSLYLFPQNVSMTGGCMLTEKCSPPLEVDPACSADVRQVFFGTYPTKLWWNFRIYVRKKV